MEDGNPIDIRGGLLVRDPSTLTRDGRFAFVPCENTVRVISLRTGAVVRLLSGHSKTVTQVSLHASNRMQLLTTSRDGTIRVWDYDDAACIRTFHASGPVISCFQDGDHGNEIYWVEEIRADAGKKMKENNKQTNWKTTNYRVCHARIPEMASAEVDLRGATEVISVVNGRNWQFHSQMKTIVYSYGNKIHVYSCITGQQETFSNSTNITAIALHGESNNIVTGDKSGKITVWFSCLCNATQPPVTTTLHWHAHAIASLSYTEDGAYLLSGGEEAVLVLWQLESGHKRFLPRLGAPIAHVSAPPSAQHYLVSLQDNSILVVSAPAFDIIKVIIGCRRAPFDSRATVGLVKDPASNNLITNGRQGTLQMYDLQRDNHVADLDIVGRTYISRTFRRHISPTSVKHAAFSSCGKVLATLEHRYDPFYTADLRLKFWSRESNGTRFRLNTVVEPPHNADVTALIVHPTENIFITTSLDASIKLWARAQGSESNQQQDREANQTHWYCYAVADYNQLPCQAAAMSPDGSYFAVACNNYLTLWHTSECELVNISELSDPTISIHQLAFLASGQSLIALSKKLACFVDIPSLDLVKVHQKSVLFLAADGKTDKYVCIESHSGSAFKAVLYSGSSKQPQLSVYLHESRPKAVSFMNVDDTPYVVVLDSNQRFCLFSPNKKGNLKMKPIKGGDSNTKPSVVPLYGSSTGDENEHSQRIYQRFFGVNEDQKFSKAHPLSSSISGNTPLDEIFNVPSHLLPPMHLLSSQFLELTLNQLSAASASNSETITSEAFTKHDTLSTTISEDYLESRVPLEENEPTLHSEEICTSAQEFVHLDLTLAPEDSTSNENPYAWCFEPLLQTVSKKMKKHLKRIDRTKLNKPADDQLKSKLQKKKKKKKKLHIVTVNKEYQESSVNPDVIDTHKPTSPLEKMHIQSDSSVILNGGFVSEFTQNQEPTNIAGTPSKNLISTKPKVVETSLTESIPQHLNTNAHGKPASIPNSIAKINGCINSPAQTSVSTRRQRQRTSTNTS